MAAHRNRNYQRIKKVSILVIIDPNLKTRLPHVLCAWAVYENVMVSSSNDVLQQALLEEQNRVKQIFTIESIVQDPGVVESRRIFKLLGLDPARYRPSQEALLRRIVQDKSIASINSGVDVNNLLSIRYRVPMGLYDAQKIVGNPVMKVGSANNVYAALNGREVQCENKLILCDHQGPIGSPYVDSQRTAIIQSTHQFLHVVYFCYNGLNEKAFEDMAKTFVEFHGGSCRGYQHLIP